MTRFLIQLWGRPGPTRLVLSFGAGCALGIIQPASSVWWALLLLVLLLRTHLISVAAGWIPGFALSFLVAPVSEYTGSWLLQRYEPFWLNLLSRPGLCCLDLTRAAVIGSSAIAIPLALLMMTGVLLLLRRCYHPFLLSHGVVS